MSALKKLIVLALALFGGLILTRAIGRRWEASQPGVQWETAQVTIDADFVRQTDDTYSLIEPLWRRVEIHEGPQVYKASLGRWSIPQQQLFAIEWYRSEVNNGGRHQFFYNSTGVVWKDALEGLEAAGAIEHARILREATSRLGVPSLDRARRVTSSATSTSMTWTTSSSTGLKT